MISSMLNAHAAVQPGQAADRPNPLPSSRNEPWSTMGWMIGRIR
jgi:hypothetical protein